MAGELRVTRRKAGLELLELRACRSHCGLRCAVPLACLVEAGLELRDFCLHGPTAVCVLRELRLTGREDRTNLGELLRGGCGCGLGRAVLLACLAQGCLKPGNLRLHGRSSLGAFRQLGVTRCKIVTKLTGP